MGLHAEHYHQRLGILAYEHGLAAKACVSQGVQSWSWSMASVRSPPFQRLEDTDSSPGNQLVTS